VHLGIFAAQEPERPAVIMGAADTVVTYAELEARTRTCSTPRCSACLTRRWVSR
jgi:hypothetical protein